MKRLTPLIQLWLNMRKANDVCNADEMIGFRAALKVLWFFLNKMDWINYELEIKQLIRVQNKLKYELDDLAHKNATLTKANKELKSLINESGLKGKQSNGLKKVDLELNGFILKPFFMNITQDELDETLSEAVNVAFEKRLKRHKEDTVRSRVIQFYRDLGYKVTA